MVGFAWNPSLVFAFTASILLALFSVGVGALGRYQGASKWYALFGGSFGAAAGMSNLSEAANTWARQTYAVFSDVPGSTFWFDTTINAIGILFSVGWFIGVVRLMQCYGARHSWMTAALGAAFGAAMYAVAVVGAVNSGTFDSISGPAVPHLVVTMSNNAAGYAVIGAMATAGWQMAQARLRKPQSGQAVLAAGLMAYPLAYPIWTTAYSASSGLPQVWVGFIALLGFTGMVAGWLQVLARQETRAPWAVIGVGAVFFGGSFFLGIFNGTRLSPSSIARTFDVVLVAYAILRLQYLGLDVKVRWGLSKSTVAAIFIAVFFIASETASQFFGDRFNNNYFGIAAAGVLVLGIAPLQRFADQLATKAIPASAAPVAGSPIAIYERQVRQAWQDGRISPSEKLMLRSLRVDLGIAVTEADAVEDRVESGLAEKLD